jgi:hypothetical protein
LTLRCILCAQQLNRVFNVVSERTHLNGQLGEKSPSLNIARELGD